MENTALIPRNLTLPNGGTFQVMQRMSDEYINVTQICKAAGKDWKHYYHNQSSQKFIKAIERSVGNPTNPLVQSIVTGPNEYRGTWACKEIAIDVARWCCPEFAVQVMKWTVAIMEGDINTIIPEVVKNHDALKHTTTLVAVKTTSDKRKRRMEEREAEIMRLEEMELTIKKQRLQLENKIEQHDEKIQQQDEKIQETKELVENLQKILNKYPRYKEMKHFVEIATENNVPAKASIFPDYITKNVKDPENWIFIPVKDKLNWSGTGYSQIKIKFTGYMKFKYQEHGDRLAYYLIPIEEWNLFI